MLSGPSFAREVGAGLAGCADGRERFGRLLASARSRRSITARCASIPATTSIGVEVGGAVKNVLAIATGIADGLGLGLNARAALITRGLAEMSRLGVALGGRAETFTGLDGPRRPDSHRDGRSVAQPHGRRAARAAAASLAEILGGARPCGRRRALRARRSGARAVAQIEMPITHAVCRVLFEDVTPRNAVRRCSAGTRRPNSARVPSARRGSICSLSVVARWRPASPISRRSTSTPSSTQRIRHFWAAAVSMARSIAPRGEELLRECETLGGCATGDAKITRGYHLPASHVIHAVGPAMERRQRKRGGDLLAACYRRSLELAERQAASRLRFPRSVAASTVFRPKKPCGSRSEP